MDGLSASLLSTMERLQEQQENWMHNAEEYILKACNWASQLGIAHGRTSAPAGNAAWSATMPAQQVFTRLKMVTTNMAQKEQAAGQPIVDDVHHALSCLELAAQQEIGDCLPAAHIAGEQDPPDQDGAPSLMQDAGPAQAQVRGLFNTSEPPLLPQLPQRRQRARRTFDMPSVLQQYVKATEGPLPESIIAALTTFLDLNDDSSNQMTEALLQHAGEGVEDLQHEQEAPLVAGA